MDKQPQITGINEDTFHPIIVLKLGMALRALHVADLGFEDTGTEWGFDVTFK